MDSTSEPLTLPEGVRLAAVFGGPRGGLRAPIDAIVPANDGCAWIVAGDDCLLVDGRSGEVVSRVVSPRCSLLRNACADGGVVLRSWDGGALRVLDREGVRDVVLPELPKRRGQEAFDEIVIGRRVLLALRGSQVLVCDPSNGSLRVRIRMTGDVRRLVLSPDEERFALWRDDTIELSEIANGARSWSTPAVGVHRERSRLAFSRDSRQVLAELRGESDGTRVLRAFDARSGATDWSLTLDRAMGETTVHIAIDQGRAALVCDRRVLVADIASGTHVETVDLPEPRPAYASFAGARVIAGRERVWWRVGAEVASEHQGAVVALASSPDERWLATRDASHGARLWRDGRFVSKLDLPEASAPPTRHDRDRLGSPSPSADRGVLDVAWLDDETVFVIDTDGRSFVRMRDGLESLEVLSEWRVEPRTLRVRDGVAWLVASSSDHREHAVLRCEREGHGIIVKAAWPVPSRSFARVEPLASEVVVLLSPGRDRVIVRLDPVTLTERRRTELPLRIVIARHEVTSVAGDLGAWAIDRAGTYVLTRLGNGQPLVRWSLETSSASEPLPSSTLDEPSIVGARFHVWRHGPRVELRDATTGEIRSTIELHPSGDRATSVALTRDERVLLIGTERGQVLQLALDLA